MPWIVVSEFVIALGDFSVYVIRLTFKYYMVLLQAAFVVALDDEPQNFDRVRFLRMIS